MKKLILMHGFSTYIDFYQSNLNLQSSSDFMDFDCICINAAKIQQWTLKSASKSCRKNRICTISSPSYNNFTVEKTGRQEVIKVKVNNTKTYEHHEL